MWNSLEEGWHFIQPTVDRFSIYFKSTSNKALLTNWMGGMREGFINQGSLLSVFDLGNWLNDAIICQNEQILWKKSFCGGKLKSSVMHCGNLNEREVQKGQDRCICTTDSFFCTL